MRMDAPSAIRGVLAAALATMGVLHFTPGPSRTMAAMIPPALRRPGVPSPRTLVAVTGCCELAGAAGLLMPSTRRAAGVALLAFYGAVLPANAYAARHPDRFGPVAMPIVPRTLLQIGIAAATAYGAFAQRPAGRAT
ncbi:DoxX family protein [Amnibacterium sp.]|uniref:DoxX family protein n=1 Tax=Amnibacterium sp. TaxID=1872496 RepID=UPI002F934ACC